MVMALSVASIGTSAIEYCGGKWLKKNEIHNGSLSKSVGEINGFTEYGGAYNSNGVKAWCGYCPFKHYARVGSGEKYKESRRSKGIAVETGYIPLKNNKARLEGWVEI